MCVRAQVHVCGACGVVCVVWHVCMHAYACVPACVCMHVCENISMDLVKL